LVMNTPAFWVKQVIYKNVAVQQVAGNFWGQLKLYFSPETLFVKIGDIDHQHQIPGTGLFYWWMIIPMISGLIGWVKNLRKNLWWIAMTIMCIIPAAMSGVFISVQRAFPVFLPLSLAVAEGLGRLKIKSYLLAVLMGYSLLLLFRSYFVLLPGLEAEAWNYGYEQISMTAKNNPDKLLVIDNSRNVRNYILPLFYLAYNPKELQQTQNRNILTKYYFSGDPEPKYKYANLEFRPIDWKNDPCKEEMIAGDELAISATQAKEHKLTQGGEIRDRTGKLLLQWYKTNPKEKCAKMAL
jgi:hypothetical protein